MLPRKRICVGSIRDSGTAKNCGFLKKAPHRTMRQMRRWSVGHDRPPVRHGKSRRHRTSVGGSGAYAIRALS